MISKKGKKMIYAKHNLILPNQQKYNTNSFDSKQCFGQTKIASNTDDKEQKQKLPTWSKILISWCIGDIITDLILIDSSTNGKDGFNLLRPFSWILKKIKK